MKDSEKLLAKIRDGLDLTSGEKLWLIISRSIPSILAQMTSTLMFFIDAAMVGALGAEASASIGIVETTTWLFGSLNAAASMGFGVQVAQAIGAKDFVKARQVVRTGLVAILCFTLFLTTLAVSVHSKLPLWMGGGEDIAHDASLYFLIVSLSLPLYQLANFSTNMLKSSGNMKIPSALNILACVLDVIFNYFFIYICGWGVPGAALGSSLAILIPAVILAYFAYWRSPMLALWREKASWRPRKEYLKRAFFIASPMGLQYSLMNIAQMISTVIVAPLGNFAIAANNFAITAEALCYMPGYGIADAATTLVGQSIGAKRVDLCKSLAWRCVGLGMLVMSVMGFIMYVFAPELMGLMTPVNEIVRLGVAALRIEAFAEPMFAAAIISSSCMIGAGDTLIPACMNLGTMWGIRLTLAYYLAPIWGLTGVWTAMAIELSMRGLIFLVRLFRGNWLKIKVAGVPAT